LTYDNENEPKAFAEMQGLFFRALSMSDSLELVPNGPSFVTKKLDIPKMIGL